MLSVEDRQEILDRFLVREERKKRNDAKLHRIDDHCASHNDFRWLIDAESVDVRKKREFLQLLVENGDWQEYVFRNGYLCSPFISSKTIRLYAEERATAIRSRYHTWKRLRPYLTSKGLTEDDRMYPAHKNCVFQILTKNRNDLIFSCMVFIQMILNYIPLYNIYMYDPIYCGNHAYRYYTGEPVIVYFLTEALAKNVHQFRRTRKALFKKKANGYSLENVWRIVLCTFDWAALDDQRGTGDYKLFTMNPAAGDIRAQCMAYWKDYIGAQSLFKTFNTLDYVKSHKVLPWPYYVKDGKLHLLDCTAGDFNQNGTSSQD